MANFNSRRKKASRLSYSEILDYAKHFTDSGFKSKVSGLAGLVGEGIIMPFLRLYCVMKSPATPRKTKLYIAGALGYFILPFDLIPDFILPLLGFTDDLAVLALVMKMVSDHLSDDIEAQARGIYNGLLRRTGLS